MVLCLNLIQFLSDRSVQQVMMCTSFAWNVYALLHIRSKMANTHIAPEVINDFNYNVQFSPQNRYNHLLARPAVYLWAVIAMGLMAAAVMTDATTLERHLGGRRGYFINLLGLESLLSAVALPVVFFVCHKEARQHLLSLLGMRSDGNTVEPMS